MYRCKVCGAPMELAGEDEKYYYLYCPVCGRTTKIPKPDPAEIIRQHIVPLWEAVRRNMEKLVNVGRIPLFGRLFIEPEAIEQVKSSIEKFYRTVTIDSFEDEVLRNFKAGRKVLWKYKLAQLKNGREYWIYVTAKWKKFPRDLQLSVITGEVKPKDKWKLYT